MLQHYCNKLSVQPHMLLQGQFVRAHDAQAGVCKGTSMSDSLDQNVLQLNVFVYDKQ